MQNIVKKLNVYIIDDNSKSNYNHIAKKFSNMMNITLIKLNKNIGPAKTRQYAIDISKSKYISDVKIDVSTGFVDDCFRATNKIVAKYNNKAVAYKIAEELNSHFPNLHAYVTTNYINIINNKISKGKSLNYLLDYYNLAKDQIYTIVKDENDISLSQYESYIIGNNQGSFKYCTKNFEEAIKKITNH